MKSEFEKFDAAMKQLVSVSHEELKRRDQKYQSMRSKKKRKIKRQPSVSDDRASGEKG